jgi:hypothetical protein
VKSKKMPHQQLGGTGTLVEEFARLAAELARLNPAKLVEIGEQVISAAGTVRTRRTK